MTGAEVVQATGGRLIAGEAAAVFPRVSIDSRGAGPGDLFFAIVGPRHDGHRFVGAALEAGAGGAVVSQPPPAEALRGARLLVHVDDTSRALGDLAASVRRRAGLSVVAVTGSAGKTTTKELAAAALAADRAAGCNPGNLNNLWGLPLSLLNLAEGTRAAVLEMGMNAPGEIARLTEIADPDVGVLTNVGPVHLEFFDDVEAIARAKGELFAGMRPDAAIVVNRDDPRVSTLAEGFRGRCIRVSAEGAPADLSATGVRFDLVRGTRFSLDGRTVRLRLPGRHAVANALAALAAVEALGVDRETALRAIESVEPLPGRGRVERLGRGMVLVDETYNANPPAVEAVLAALAATEWTGRRVLVLGDMLELGEEGAELHRRAVREAARRGVDLLVGIGPLAAEACEAAGEDLTTLSFADSDRAAGEAEGILRDGDLVVVKGSRGMATERFAGAMRAAAGGGA